MDIPENYGQANLFLPTVNWPNVPEVTIGVSMVSSADPLVDVAQRIYDTFADNILPLLTGNTTLSKVRLKSGPNETGAFVEVAGSETGTSSDPTEPPAVAALIKKNTGHGGRQGSGRMYLPALPDGSVDAAGRLEGTGATVITAAFNDWLSDMATAGTPLVLLHGASGGAAPFVIDSFACELQVGTQRRRNRK